MKQRDHSVAAASTENGIGREAGGGSAQRGRSVIYDCLVYTCLKYYIYGNKLSETDKLRLRLTVAAHFVLVR